jgi:hypothetical protein
MYGFKANISLILSEAISLNCPFQLLQLPFLQISVYQHHVSSIFRRWELQNESQYEATKGGSRRGFEQGSTRFIDWYDKSMINFITSAILSSHMLEVVIAPPSIYLISLKDIVRKDIQVAAQNCYFKESGAFTGEIRFGKISRSLLANVLIVLSQSAPGSSLMLEFHMLFSVRLLSVNSKRVLYLNLCRSL